MRMFEFHLSLESFQFEFTSCSFHPRLLWEPIIYTDLFVLRWHYTFWKWHHPDNGAETGLSRDHKAGVLPEREKCLLPQWPYILNVLSLYKKKAFNGSQPPKDNNVSFIYKENHQISCSNFLSFSEKLLCTFFVVSECNFLLWCYESFSRLCKPVSITVMFLMQSHIIC